MAAHLVGSGPKLGFEVQAGVVGLFLSASFSHNDLVHLRSSRLAVEKVFIAGDMLGAPSVKFREVAPARHRRKLAIVFARCKPCSFIDPADAGRSFIN